jgi:hypothetical protein
MPASIKGCKPASSMHTIISFYKKHKAAIIAYVFYLLFWWLSLNTQSNFHTAIGHISQGERIAWGEGVMYWYLLTYAVSIGATIVMLLNAAIKVGERGFYLTMAALVICPLLIFISVKGI